jgi:hypothetical protein
MAEQPSENPEEAQAKVCVWCRLPIGSESAFVEIAEARFAHTDCVNPPHYDKPALKKDTVRALSEVSARGQGGPI